MSMFRAKVLAQYQNELVKKEGLLLEVKQLIPDFENLRNSERTNRERKRLLQMRRNLEHDIEELKGMIEEIKTINEERASKA